MNKNDVKKSDLVIEHFGRLAMAGVTNKLAPVRASEGLISCRANRITCEVTAAGFGRPDKSTPSRLTSKYSHWMEVASHGMMKRTCLGSMLVATLSL